MRKLSKAICVALSLTMLINLAGFEVLAADVDTTGTKSAVTDDADTTTDNATDDKTDVSGEVPEGTVITDEDVKNNESDADVLDNKDDVTEDSEDDVVPADEQTDAESEELAVQAKADAVKAVPVSGSSNKMTVSWNEVSDADGYKVSVYDFIASSTNLGTVKKEYKDIKATTQDIDVTAGAKYLVKVEAVMANGKTTEVGIIPVILLSAPSNLKATAGSASVKLSWTAVSGASSYQVVYGSKTASASAVSYDATGLTNGTKYDFKVHAVCTLTYNGKDYTYNSAEAAVSATPKSEKPAQVTGLSGIDGDKSAILTWSKAARATSYSVYRYNSSTKKWVVVKNNIKKLTYTDTKLTAGKKYQYRVAAVNDGGTGAVSSTVTISVKKTPGTKVRTIGYKAIVKSRAPIFTGRKSSKRVKYLSKGTRITTIDYGSGRYQFKLSNGKTYWISKDRLSFTASIWTTKDYSTKVKEDFVNKKGYKSPSKYLIWINQYTQRVIIFQGKKGHWKMIRNCRCATGTHLHMTPKGTYKITYKEKGWFYRSTYEKPIVHFKSQNSFHSRIKNYKGGYADATIGKPRSKGCVRLYDEDINFIYKKCPKGTTVVSH